MEPFPFFLTYYVPALEFVVELVIITVLFFRNLNRRSKFIPRSLLAFAIVLVLSLAASWLLFLVGDYAFGKALSYLLLFGGLTAVTMIPFRESYRTLFFFSCIAYAVQNLIYKTFLFFWTGAEAFNWFQGWELDSYWRAYRIASYAAFILLTIVLWFFFLKKTSQRFVSRKLNSQMLIITFFILLSTLVLCSIDDVYFSKLSSGGIALRFDGPVLYILRENGNVFSILCCIIVLFLASRSIVTNELMQEVEYLKHTIRQGEMQYEISKDTIEMINVKCHDIKYKLGALAAENNLSDESVKELSDSVRIYDSRLQTGNQMLNVLLWEKALYCEQNDIVFAAMVDGQSLDFIESGDLYCLFGNMVDNALEAVKNIKEKPRRVINLVAKKKGNLFLIQEDNYFDGNLVFEDGLPVTTKEDTAYHGFGTRSLRMIVRKYGGELTCYVEKDIFHLNIILTLP